MLEVVKVVLQLTAPLDLFGFLSLSLHCASVIQAKFQEYLAMSDSFFTGFIEKGSDETLPVVRVAYIYNVEFVLYCFSQQGWQRRCLWAKDEQLTMYNANVSC